LPLALMTVQKRTLSVQADLDRAQKKLGLVVDPDFDDSQPL